MKPLAVVGTPDQDRSAVVDRLVGALAEHGAVATVDCGSSSGTATDEPADRSDGEAEVHWAFGNGGTWTARGDERTVATVDDVLARLAPTHDYAILDGATEADVPTVAIGDATATGPVIATPADPADLAVADAVADLERAEPFETLESLVARAKTAQGTDRAGAIATFTGRVRRKDGDDDVPTEHLAFEKHEGVADERMATIREELRARDGVFEVLLHHRTGVVHAGEDIVFVVVLAGHRDEAFGTVRDGIDRLKAEVPLFKKEVTLEGEFWRHERPAE